MTENLFFSEIMLMIVVCIAAMTARQFFKTKNGVLRKLMIAYFSVEVYVYGSSALYFWLLEKTSFRMGIDAFRVMVLLPKAIVMMCIFWYLGKKSKQ